MKSLLERLFKGFKSVDDKTVALETRTDALEQLPKIHGNFDIYIQDEAPTSDGVWINTNINQFTGLAIVTGKQIGRAHV